MELAAQSSGPEVFGINSGNDEYEHERDEPGHGQQTGGGFVVRMKIYCGVLVRKRTKMSEPAQCHAKARGDCQNRGPSLFSG